MKFNILCAFGGCSPEHEISILTALEMMKQEPSDFCYIPLYIDRKNRWYSGEALKEKDCYLQEEYQYLPEVELRNRKGQAYLYEKRFPFRRKAIDFVMPLFHGGNGEDGSFQGYLKVMDIPFSGPSLETCAMAHSKVRMKHLLQEAGIPVVPWFEISSDTPQEEALYEKSRRLGYPLIVKPASCGSSIGITVANDIYAFAEALKTAFRYDHQVLAERYFADVREFHAAVMGDCGNYTCSEIEEISRQDTIFSFQEKYEGDGKRKGELLEDEELAEEIRHWLKQCAEALNLSGMIRIDFLYSSEQLYVNEINVIPGSLAAYLWDAQMDCAMLVRNLVRIGLRREHQEAVLHKGGIVSLEALHHKK